jgi:D-alanyl-D-alanine carboxypeptidase (penicillin-binding protein 5/6)
MRAWFAAAIAALSFTTGAYAAVDINAREAFAVDFATGTELLNKGADTQMPPSSMSKLMTAYVVFKRLKEGSVKLTDEFVVSEKAWRTGGSKMFIHVGDFVKLEDLLRGMIVQSGNDACVALAEGIAGSEEAFATEMNKVAAEIGMKASNFMNATGLPDDNHYTTARDLATLGRRLIIDFPEYYHYYSELDFTYNNIKQGNRNPLLYNNNLNVDGLKTGHTDKAGYGVTVSGVNPRDGRRVIMVINGLPSMQARANEARSLLTYAYMNFENAQVAKKGAVIDSLPVWRGQAPNVAIAANEDVVLTLPRGAGSKVTATVRAAGPVPAPVKAGTQVAELHIEAEGQEARIIPLYAQEDVAGLSGLQRLLPNLSHMLFGARE